MSQKIYHKPFITRINIVLAGLSLAILVAYLTKNETIGAATYGIAVTILDLFAHHILKIKPSYYADPFRLLYEQHITLENFDIYYRKVKNIRLTSTLISLILWSGFLRFTDYDPFLIFALTYGIFSRFGIVALHFSSSQPTPVKVRFYKYKIPEWMPYKPKHGMSLAQRRMNESLNSDNPGGGPFPVLPLE